MVNSKENNPAILDIYTETAKTVSTNKSDGGGKRRSKKSHKGSRDNLLVWDFLVSRLDSECYGEDLRWLDRSRGVFFIRWVHQSSKMFDRDGPNVFQDWSAMKSHWDDEDPERHAKAKQRVQAAFLKQKDLIRVEMGKSHRVYRIKNFEDYLKMDKKSKEKKNRRLRNCTTGCAECEHMYQFLKSGAKVSGYQDVDMVDVKNDNKPYAGGKGSQKTRSPAEMECAFALLILRYGCHWQPQHPHSAVDPLDLSPHGTTPASEPRKVDQVVPEEAAMSSPDASSAEDEGIMAPDSVVVNEEQVAALRALNPLLVQPDTGSGDSPLVFWA
ncbi:uncharacterized protein LOC142772292 [Rhipicephalus microplus]|uniref:uncharacterized protein LOC142772292 n=1 Tax=Rhipicephalus microplus TaxID=6941 RepID=UPI003F6A560A